MRFVHDRIFPVVCHLSQHEDKELQLCADYLHSTGFSAERLGLAEDFCVPPTAAVVELASLDMRSTPLDRLTCFYDAVEQLNTHIREAVLASRADSEDVSSELLFYQPFKKQIIRLLYSSRGPPVSRRPRHGAAPRHRHRCRQTYAPNVHPQLCRPVRVERAHRHDVRQRGFIL